MQFITRLVQLLDPKKLRYTKSWVFYAFGSAQNATFWKKLRFGPRQKTLSKRANIMDRRRSINQNVHARLNNTIGLDGQLRKYPDKNSSILTLDGLNLLPLLLLSFVFFNEHWSFFFFFNLIWEIHFEGRDLLNKTPSNTDPLTSLPSTKEKRETWMWVWPKTQTQMLLCLAMGLSPTILRQQHRQKPTDEVLRKKKKRWRRRALNVLEFGGMARKKRRKEG